MTPRARVRAGLLATVDGLFATVLGLLNVPVLALWLIGLLLSPIPTLGIELLSVTTTVVRWRADLERRLAARAGIPIRRPYPPAPDRAEFGAGG